MARSEVKLENEAAQSTNALGPLIGVAREDFVSAVALLLRETASDPSRFVRHSTAMAQDMVKIFKKNESSGSGSRALHIRQN